MALDEAFVTVLEDICVLRRGEAVAALNPGFHESNLGAGIVVFPENADEVCDVVKLCGEHGVSIIPHGGRTGLAGAGASQPGQLVVDMSRMNSTGEVDPVSGTIVAEAGATLQSVQERCAQHALTPGIDLAARGSATIGGMISTNAGGMEAFRCGVMRHRVLGLEAVMPDGMIFSDMTRVTKVNEGLDIKQLLIGAEGRLGIVTRAVLKLEALSKATATALASFATAGDAVQAFHHLRRVSALLRAEVMWRGYGDVVAADLGLENLLADFAGDVLVLFEVAGDDGVAAMNGIENALGALLEGDAMIHAVIAQNDRQAADFWRIREESWAVERVWPGGLWYDVSVPLDRLDEYAQELAQRVSAISGDLHLSCMGHLGDGNLHITVAAPGGVTPDKKQVDNAVFAGLKQCGGSFSAEHGVGLEKMAALERHGDPGRLAAARAVKLALDPQNLMNPGKVLV